MVIVIIKGTLDIKRAAFAMDSKLGELTLNESKEILKVCQISDISNINLLFQHLACPFSMIRP